MAKAPSRAKVAILISGSGTNMAALLYAAKHPECPYEVVLVGSNDPAAAGLQLAKAEGIATFAHPHKGMERAAHDAVMDEAIRAADAEYVALAGYMRILTPEFVAQWEGRMLNIHPSLLPKYKGLHTHERALAAGDSHGGASVHLVTAELDDGPILGQMSVAIIPGDSADTLAARVKFAEHQLYPTILSDYVSRYDNPDWLLAKVEALALALPETHARTSHGSPGFRVGSEKTGKYFAYFADQHHGSDAIGVLVKTGGMDELETLCEQQPDMYWKPAFYGASGWVGLRLNRPGVDWDHVREWLERSWRAVAPKSVTKLMDVAAEF
ncbi:phosphoribosylglycinamide formyltransferase [Sphingorhabdus arenilitoris]|uniref:Phosphoribosylglycinamide formyltransferase n=1 Tax=Sphingorhabdus arenilitoris TaxID=1490041 RepID=A0ABV8RER1_9SPHN